MAGIGVNLITQQTTDKDELFICPFDPVHRISAKRYVYHIMKCRKNHPHLETATCPFNARHVVLKPELRHHTSVCPDRKTVELELNSLDISEPPNDHLAASNEVLDFGDDEDWDEEIERNRNLNVFDPFASGTKDFTTYTSHVKKTNTRREAIKNMKERMRREAEARGEFPPMRASWHDDVSLRRPHFEAGAKTKAFETFYASISSKSNASSKISQENGLFPSSLSRVEPRLAANFSMPPKMPALGRGRHLRELQAVAVGRGRAVQLAEGKTHDKMSSLKGSSSMNGVASAEDKFNHLGAANNTDWGFEVVPSRRKKKITQ